MKKIVLAFIALSFVSVSAFAAGDGSSGCGAGWYLFKENTILFSSLRATTNGLLSNNTFGMTFGTSNCQKHSIVQKEKEAVYFAESNQESLTLEMAEGKGQYVEAFAKTLGCNDSVISNFTQMTKKNYSKIISSDSVSAHDMLDQVKSEIKKDSVLSRSCITNLALI